MVGSKSHAKVEERERVFAAEYVKARFNGTDAAIAAGLAPRSATQEASKLLRKPNVQAMIAAAVNRHLVKHDLTADKIVMELKQIGFANMADYVGVDGNGNPYLDFTNVSRDKFAAVGEITVDEYTEGSGDDARNVKRTKFKLLDKKGALVDLLKWVDRSYANDAERAKAGGDTYNIIMNMPGVAAPKLDAPSDAKSIGAKVISIGQDRND